MEIDDAVYNTGRTVWSDMCTLSHWRTRIKNKSGDANLTEKMDQWEIKFWRIATDKANSMENFGRSDSNFLLYIKCW